MFEVADITKILVTLRNRVILSFILMLVVTTVTAELKNPKPGQCSNKSRFTELQALSFGDIVASLPGQVTVATDGLLTYTGGVLPVGGAVSQALFEVTTVAGCEIFAHVITLPANATLSSATSSMTVNSFTSDVSIPTLIDSTGVGLFSVGATLNVGASQPSGVYSGQFAIDITFQ